MSHACSQRSAGSALAARTAAVVGVMAAMSASASVRIPLPFTPVPVTLQTGVVLLAGLLLGGPLAGAGIVGYLVLGAAGAPVFAGATGGAAALAGPTGGYLVGFAVAAAFLGAVSRRRPLGLPALLAVLVLADALVFACGVAWLGVQCGGGARRLLDIGVAPFLPGEALKIGCVAAAFDACRRRRPLIG
jgi:biotin transport system substrate-specific component